MRSAVRAWRGLRGWVAAIGAVASLSLSAPAPAQPPAQAGSPAQIPVDLALDLAQPYLACDACWPQRIVTHDGASGITVPVAGPVGAWRGEFVGFVAPDDDADMDDLGRFRDAVGGDRDLALEGPNSFLVRLLPQAQARPRQAQAWRDLRVLSGSLRVPLPRAEAPDQAPVVLVQRTWFALYEPDAGWDDAAGAALLIPGMFGTPEGVLEQIVKRFRANRWGVVRMISHPSRFTERATFTIDRATPLAESARPIADTFGDRAAECAYAAHDAFAWLEREIPMLRDKPRAALGISGGAMIMPTVVARDPDRYAAVILIGGGAHYWLVSVRSSYQDMVRATRTRWLGGSDPGTPEETRALAEEYLKLAPLDSFHTAGVLRGKPTLMIQAQSDLAVPTPLGDALWERAGRPDRWTHPGGHEVLFLQLPRDYDAMMQWLAHAVEPRIAPAAPRANPEPARSP